jgi:hypothetical protein
MYSQCASPFFAFQAKNIEGLVIDVIKMQKLLATKELSKVPIKQRSERMHMLSIKVEK